MQIGFRFLIVLGLTGPWLAARPSYGEEPPAPAPATPQEVWEGYDPRAEPLDIEVVREWTEDGAAYRELRFTGMTHEGTPVRVYAIYAAPVGGKNLPAVLHIHGGGQSAYAGWPKYWAARGYAALTFDFTGRWANREKFTDWGKLTHGNNMDAGTMLAATEPSVRSSTWYLWMCVARRALTALETQPEVDPERLGIFGISIGGTITWPVAAMDKRVKAACAIYGVGWNNYPIDVTEADLGASDPATQTWRKTMASEAYAPLVTCPMLFLNSTNDQHGNMDRGWDTLDRVTAPVRAAFTPRYRHHIKAEEGHNLPLWMDTWLKDERIAWPKSPAMRIDLDGNGVPRLTLTADQPGDVATAELFYGVENRYPINRNWRSVSARKEGSVWVAQAPVMDTGRPLYAFATVHYTSGICLSSNMMTVIPGELGAAVATDTRSPIISDFHDGLDGWITTSTATDPIEPVPSLIQLAEGPGGVRGVTVRAAIPLQNHRPGDPKWRGPDGAKLHFEVFAAAPKTVKVIMHEKEFAIGWTKYVKTLDLKPSEGWQTIELEPGDFVTDKGIALVNWSPIQMIELDSAGGEGKEPIYAGFRWKPFVVSATSIWEPPLPAEPFDVSPFRPVRVPEWVNRLTRMGYTLSLFDDANRSRLAGAGVQMSELFFMEPAGASYPNGFVATRALKRDDEFMGKEIASYNRNQIGILAVVQPGLQAETYALHPEWRRIPTNTTDIPSVDLAKQPIGSSLCTLGPWGDRLVEILADITTRYPDVKAFSFDGIHHYDTCYCQYCRKAYRDATGKEIPDRNMDDPEFRRYVHFMDRRMEGLIRRMQTAIKAVRSDVGIITWTTNAGRFGHFMTLPRNMPARMNLLFDAVDQEFWMDETNRGSTVVSAFANAYIWAVTNHRVAYSTPYLMSHGNPYGSDSLPPLEYLHRAMLALTHGARPSTIFAVDTPLQNTAVDILGEIKKRERWMTHLKPEPWAALVMSDDTNCFYGRDPGKVEERYLSHVLGVFRTGLEEHLPLTVINDWNLTESDLSRYKVLVLANTACLSEAQAQAVRAFVKNGGGLVASGDASLYNELGDRRENFALADVFGVDYRGIPDSKGTTEGLDPNFAVAVDAAYHAQRINIFDLRLPADSPLAQCPRWKSYVPSGSVTFKGRANRVALNSDQAAAIGFMRLREEGADEVPAAVAHTYGKGRVIYFAAGLDSAYYLYPYPYQRVLIDSAIRRVAAAPPPIHIDAPMCVQATVFSQDHDGRRLIVNLYNAINTTSGHALPIDDVPLREETVPIHGIKVTFSKDCKIHKVTLQPENQELQLHPVPGGIQVLVPRLDIHTMIVADLTPEM